MNPLAMLQQMSLYPQQTYEGLLSEEQLAAARKYGMLNMGASMLANSGWSPQKRGFGEILGRGVIQGSAAQGQALQGAAQMQMMKEMREQKMAEANRPKWTERRIGNEVVQGYEMPDGTFQPVGVGTHFRPSDPKAPTTRRIRRGEVEVDQEYDAARGEWRDVGQGPRLGRTPDDTQALRRGDQRYEETRGAVNSVEGAMSLLRKLSPGVSGMRGVAGEAVSGVLGQYSPMAGEMAAKSITGVSDQDLAEIRTEAMTLAARLVPVTTGENSGRISDKEREISKDIAAGNLNFLKSPTQARGSLIILTQIALKDEYITRALNGEPVANDLNTPDGVDRMQEALVGRGMTDEEAIRVIKEVRNATLPLMGQGELRPLF